MTALSDDELATMTVASQHSDDLRVPVPHRVHGPPPATNCAGCVNTSPAHLRAATTRRRRSMAKDIDALLEQQAIR